MLVRVLGVDAEPAFHRVAAALAVGALAQPIGGLQAFEQFLVLGLLLHHEHNYSEALARPTHGVTSRDVKRAIDFIEGNIGVPIGIADIVAASAVSGRALFKHFRRFTGLSPMQYVREARLRRVREALLTAAPEERIASIAARWGFSHPGRFASEYRRRFGETPFDTKRRPHSRSLPRLRPR